MMNPSPTLTGILALAALAAPAYAQDGPAYLRLDLAGLLPGGKALRVDLSRRGTGVVTGEAEPGALRCNELAWSAGKVAGPVTGHATIDGQRRDLALTIEATVEGVALRGTWRGTVGGGAEKGALTGSVVRRRIWLDTLDSSQGCFYDPAILALEVDDGHRVVLDLRPRSHGTSGRSGNSLQGLRGVCANPSSDLFYYSIAHGAADKFYGRPVYRRGNFFLLGCVDLRTGKVVWEVPVGGANDPTLLFNGRHIFLPRFWTGSCHPDDNFEEWKAKTGWGLESLMWELDATTGQVTRYFTDYRAVVDKHIRAFGPGGLLPEMLNAGLLGYGTCFQDSGMKKSAPFAFTKPGKPPILMPLDPALLPEEANGPAAPRVGELGGRYGPVGSYDHTRVYYGPGGGKVARVLTFDLTGETPRHIGTWGRELAMTGSTLDGKNKSGAWPSKGGDLVWTSESWYFDSQTGEALGEWQDAKGKRFRCCKILEVHDVDGDVVWCGMRRGGRGLYEGDAGEHAVNAAALRRGWGADLLDDLKGLGAFFLDDRAAAVDGLAKRDPAGRGALAKRLMPLLNHSALPVRLAAVEVLRLMLPESTAVRAELITRLAKLAPEKLERQVAYPLADLVLAMWLRDQKDPALARPVGTLLLDDLFTLGRDPERYAAGHGRIILAMGGGDAVALVGELLGARADVYGAVDRSGKWPKEGGEAYREANDLAAWLATQAPSALAKLKPQIEHAISKADDARLRAAMAKNKWEPKSPDALIGRLRALLGRAGSEERP